MIRLKLLISLLFCSLIISAENEMCLVFLQNDGFKIAIPFSDNPVFSFSKDNPSEMIITTSSSVFSFNTVQLYKLTEEIFDPDVILAESLSLSDTEWSGKIGESFKITATVFPENTTDSTISWTSSDQYVAIVNQEGKVTAIAIGEADITASATDGSNLNAVCHVTVLPILAGSITLTPIEWSGSEGESFSIIANVLPENTTDPTLEWTSSEQSVAIVDKDGLVSVLKPGNCVITAKTTDGSNLTADCIITSTSGLNAIFNEDSCAWDVYNVAGSMIIKDGNSEQLRQLQSGLYIFRHGKRSIKVLVR